MTGWGRFGRDKGIINRKSGPQNIDEVGRLPVIDTRLSKINEDLEYFNQMR